MIEQAWEDPAAVARADACAQALAARADIRSLLPNLAHLPVECWTGLRDQNTPTEWGYLLPRLLRAHGGQARVHVTPLGHDLRAPYCCWAQIRTELLQHRRADPATRLPIRHRVAALRHARSAWVEALALDDYAALGEFTVLGATVGENGGQAIYRLQTHNLTALRIDPLVLLPRAARGAMRDPG